MCVSLVAGINKPLGNKGYDSDPFREFLRQREAPSRTISDEQRSQKWCRLEAGGICSRRANGLFAQASPARQS
jgi:hypothetical protein